MTEDRAVTTRRKRWIRQEYFGPLIVVLFYLFSLATVISRDWRSKGSGDEEEIVITFCHWQLETACREGFDWLADEYRKIRPNVRVKQLAVGGNGGRYNQWLTTQILGGTAPDLIEIPGLPRPVLITFCSRYFVPLSELTTQPNPFNEGTELEGVPMRETFIDNLKCAYVPELQEFYGLPMTLVNSRMYYNVRLLKELTGLDTPPSDLHAFLEACRIIREHEDSKGRPYIPIAGSTFSYSVLRNWVMPPLSHKAVPLVDGAMDGEADGYASQDEMFFAWAKGMIDFREDPFRHSHEAMRSVVEQFQPGWLSMDRDLSLFMFCQERAVFIPTGTWDYRSLASQAAFPLKVFSVPVPAKDDPVFGDTVAGPVFEQPTADARFALNKKTKHPKEALDFLLWFMSKETNERFSAKIGWLPSIKKAAIPPEMVPFRPTLNGVQGPREIALGNRTWVRYDQLSQSFMLGRLSYDEMVDDYEEESLKEFAAVDFQERTDDLRRAIFAREATAVQMRGRLLSSTSEATRDRLQKKYHEYACDLVGLPTQVLDRQQLLDDLNKKELKAKLGDGS